ncbi:MAG: MG2 domain-containing protein, partial [Cyclobacteriaceae bacterium]
QRENPCHLSYYRPDNFALTSLLASDLGLMAKIGADNSMNIFTTDMRTAQPVQASITVLDYQLQELKNVNADATGQARVLPERRPFLIIADYQGQKSYLKLNDNTSLSMSNFDVSGDRVRGGLKGFIYGERGVWRPGDDIYLSFMLEDPSDKIPAQHPVAMELRDPRGTVQDKQVLTNGVNGLYTFKTKTASDAATGNWQAKFTVGNNQFNKTVKVETIKPNRLKINLDLGDKRIPYADRNLTGRMEVNWLTGLKGSNLAVETELRLTETNTTFEGFGQYDFDDSGKSFYQNPQVVYEGKLDEEGKTNFEVNLPSKPQSPGAIRATFNTKAFEPGGGFSINAESYTYLPYETFVGINLTSADANNRIERDQPQNLAVVSLNSDGRAVSKSGLEFKLYRLNWRWWWDESSDNSTNYISSGYATLVQSETFDTQEDKANVSFEINSPSWGRFIAVVNDPSSGHSASKVFYTSWYGGDGDSSLGASSLEVSTDKTEYAVGETIKVTMKGSLEGQALVSVENGSTVLNNFWVKSEREWTTLEIPATANMAPNVYLHVTLLQPHGQTVNDLPIRLYGIAPIKVFDPKTKITPIISMKDELEPGGLVEIEISEANDRPMSYTLAVVDEGLLDITGFKTPQPWDHFYSKESIGVKTWDMYDEVIGAYGGRLERLMAIGGGEGSLSDTDKMQENRFKPVVQFMGPYYLSAGETAEHSFTMPEYIGSVKTMVVAGLDQTYGSVDKTTPVVKPLMVQGTMPRVVGPGETVSLPVNVFRYVDQIKEASVEVTATGVLSLTGEKTQTIMLDKESGTLYFDLEVAERTGSGQITVNARSGRENARHEINMVSRAPNTAQTVAKVVQIEKGQSRELDIDLFGMDGTNEVSLEVASIPSINIEQRLQYLMRYPHGCIEQTVSAVFPQLYLGHVTTLSSEQRVQIETNIQAAIKSLSRFQISGGGMSYWPGSGRSSSWGSSYAYHFLIEAQKMGYAVPTDLIDGLRKFQKSKATQWTKSTDHWDSDLIQSYRLFTLAIAGYPELGAMNRLRSTSGKSYQAICKLAAAYAVIGRKDAARSLLSGSDIKLKKEPYSYYYYSYGSYHRDLAILLETRVYLEDYTEAFKVIQELSDQLSSGEWMSTQETAYALLAIGKYVEANGADRPLEAAISYGNTQTTWKAEKALYRSAINPDDGDKLIVRNNGEATLFATLTITGTPKPGDEVIDQSDLGITVRYVDQTGRPMKPDSVQLGSSFDVLVTVKNQYAYGAVRDIALSHILPSGWEIQNDRLNEQQSDEYSTYDYQDIRDDRVYTYFHLASKESKTFKVSVTAAYPGKFYMSGAYAEAMYRASIHAKNPGKWVSVYE